MRPAPGPDDPRFVRLDLRAMLAGPPPPVRWLMAPLLVLGTLTQLFGREGQGKSLVALAVSLALVHGESIAGMAARRPVPVVYLDGENGEYIIRQRLRALGLREPAVDRFPVYDVRGVDLKRPRDRADVAALAGQHDPALVVLDAFRSLWSGNENDPGEVGPVLVDLRRPFLERDGAGLILHHTGKAGDEYRGSTAIGGVVDASFHLGRRPEDDPTSALARKAGGPQDEARRFLNCRKMRVAPEPPPLWLRLATDLGATFLEAGVDPDAVDREPRPPGRPAKAREALTGKVAAAVGRSLNGGLTLAEVARAIGRDPKDGSVRRVLAALVDAGEVVNDGGLYRKC